VGEGGQLVEVDRWVGLAVEALGSGEEEEGPDEMEEGQ